MILISEDKHLRLDPEGRLFWQADATNPTPGVEAGRVVKGDALLSPKVEASGDIPVADLQSALDRAVHFALLPLFTLVGGEGFTEASKAIADKLQGALGILPREDLETLIAGLDEEGRKVLRARKVRMGPLLVFMPELNKPAAVNLRAFLLSVWHDKPLPAEKPNDGIVSFSVEGKEIDKEYYRSIGYPVYGPRSIRVDMLDRVVCAVYDGAKDGHFQAQHQMAEWLGSNIADLYAVLEAMGHSKTHDPLEEKIKADEAALASAEPVEEKPADKPAEEVAAETPATDKPADAPTAKPELATFKLKRGKATSSPKPAYKSPDKKKFEGAKDKRKAKGGKPKGPRKNDKGRPPREDTERVYSAKPKTLEESPFAILQQLKTGAKE